MSRWQQRLRGRHWQAWMNEHITEVYRAMYWWKKCKDLLWRWKRSARRGTGPRASLAARVLHARRSRCSLLCAHALPSHALLHLGVELHTIVMLKENGYLLPKTGVFNRNCFGVRPEWLGSVYSTIAWGSDSECAWRTRNSTPASNADCRSGMFGPPSQTGRVRGRHSRRLGDECSGRDLSAVSACHSGRSVTSSVGGKNLVAAAGFSNGEAEGGTPRGLRIPF
jgi:hypothetical protein